MGTIINSAVFLSSRSSGSEDKPAGAAAPSSDKKVNINGAGTVLRNNHRNIINGRSLTSSLLIISLMIFTIFFLFIFLNGKSDLLINTNYEIILIRNSTNFNDRAEEQQPIRIIEMNITSAGSNMIKKEIRRKKTKIPFGLPAAGKKRRGGGGGGGEYCDVFSGKWVLDNSSSYPLYTEESCSFNDEGFMCKTFGRPDSEFRRWRWQPHHCDLPRFNATFMLEALRGKRMLFVGDSLNRNQFVSMACLLQSVVPDHFKSFKINGSLSTFYAKNYNATVEFYWAPLLFESNCDDPGFHRLEKRIVRLNSIEKHAQHWKGAEIIVFNSYIWWVTGQKMKMLRGSFDDKTQNIVELDTDDAYRIGLEGMAHWVEESMDPLRTRVFFTSMSPYHMWAKEWGTEEEGNCYNQTSPIDDPNYWGSGLSKSMMNVTEDVLRKTKVPIMFLNISQLSLYRKDAHSSIYRKHWTPLTENEIANPRSYADCIHWCVPGVPDTWNELLYAKLFYP